MDRTRPFIAGALVFLAVQSLLQDAVGWRAWIIYELTTWAPAWRTVPAALLVLAFAAILLHPSRDN